MSRPGIFRAFRPEYIRSQYYKKVLLSFLLCSCAVALLFSGILLYSSNRDYDRSLAANQAQSLSQALNINDANLTDIITYCNNQLNTSTLNAALFGGEMTTAQSYDILEINTAMRRMSSLINSVYFINFRTGTVIDHNGRSIIANHPDTDIFLRLGAMTPGRSAQLCVPREINYISGGHLYSGKRVISAIFYPNTSGALVVNVDYDAYSALFAVDAGEHVRLTMVNSSGQVFLSTGPDGFGADMSGDPVYTAVRDQAENRGTMPYSDGGGSYSVSWIKNSGLGITYICSRDSLPFYSDNVQLFRLMRIALLLVLVGLVLSLVLSRLLYDPLKQLKQTVSKVRPAGDDKDVNPYDDFGYLASAYQEIADMNSRLLENSSELKNTRLLAYLLYDIRDGSVTARDLEDLDASFPETSYSVLVCGLDLTEGDPGMETALLKFAVQNVCQELLSPVTGVYHVPLNSELVVFLLNFDALDVKKLTEAVREAQSFISGNFSVTFSAGLGDTVHDLTDLSQSFADAGQACARRFLTGGSSFHVYAEPESPAQAQEYPYAQSQALLDGIRGLSEGEVRRQTAAFFEALRGCGIDEILSFTIQLHFTLQRMERQSYLSAEGDWSYKALEKSTLTDIQRRMTDRCLADVGQLAQIRDASGGRRELTDRIKALVEENIYSPELSVAFLADKVHLSVNYLRNVFKESAGDSLSGYINRRKIDLICRLLTETDMTLSEINDKLGFSTSNYFYAFFKKHMGMTPGDYRKNMKRQDVTVAKLK